MSRSVKFLAGAGFVVVVILAVGGGLFRSGGESGQAAVTIGRGDLVIQALAVGTIEPETEVAVKSKVSGVVRQAFAEEGDFVRAGDPLLEIRPDPTPLELVEARRALELRELEADRLRRDRDRERTLFDSGLVTAEAMEAAENAFTQASLQVDAARDRLQLLEQGRISGGTTAVESAVVAPIDGYVLERNVEEGDPVVPLSSYQEGTVVMRMADMDRLIFRGTVDEIDVGRLKEGMPARIRIGALPEADVRGTVSHISLKATDVNNATVFPIEVVLTGLAEVRLRAGYSAGADIVLDERHDVVLVPERVVYYEGDSASVDLLLTDGTVERRTIRVGASDAIHAEVLSGLEEGDRVLEKPLRTVQ